MRMSVDIVERDLGMMEIFKRVKAAGAGGYAKVGVLDSGAGAASRDGGLTSAQIAAVHEFGSRDGSIPERSFIRSTLAEERPKYVALFRTLLTQFLRGRGTIERLLGIVGATAATDVKKKVTAGSGVGPANAASTIARKGSDRPLIDTARMLGAMTWDVILGRGVR